MLAALTLIASAQAPVVYSDESRHTLSVFTGKFTASGLPDEILMLRPIEFDDAWITVVNYGYLLSAPTPARRWEGELQVGFHTGEQDHVEFNGALLHRWSDWPWDGLLNTSFALGAGLSWAHQIPALEAAGKPGENASRMLFYMALEFEAMPAHTDRWSIFGRIHHRSGVFGTFGGVHGGSDHIGVGVRWYIGR